MDQQSISLNDAADIFRRRWPITATTALVVFLAAMVTAFTLENVYRSVGKVSVTEPEYGVGGGGKPILPLELRIYELTDEVITRANLIEAVEKFNLYPEDRIDDSPGSVTGLVRQNLEVEVVRKDTDPADRNLGKVVGFTVTYYHDNPREAQQVARFVVDKFVDAKDARRAAIFGGAVTQLELEAADLDSRLREKQEELARFKEQYPDAMPEQQRWNMQQVEIKSNRLAQVEMTVRGLEAREAGILNDLRSIPPFAGEGELGEQIQTLQEQFIRLIGIYTADHPEVRRVRRQLETLLGADSNFILRQMLEVQLRGELEKLAAMTYGPDHPERRAAERRAGALREELAALPADGPETREPTNPMYISAELQLRAARTELRAQQDRRQTIEAEIRDLEESLNIAPRVELQLQAILRDITLLEDNLEDRNQALEGVKTGERRDPWETWRTTYPSIDFVPVFPNRPLYVVLGAFIGLTLGIGAGLIMEALDSTIRGTRDVRSVMQMPPIAAIPVIKTDSDRRRDRLRLATVTGMVLVAVGAVGAYIHFQISGII